MDQEQGKSNFDYLLISIQKSRGLQTNFPHQTLTQEAIFDLIFKEKWGLSKTMTALIQYIRQNEQDSPELTELANQMENFINTNRTLPFLP